MKLFRDISVRWEQMIVILVSTSAALLIAGGSMAAYDLTHFRREMTESLSTIAAAIGSQIRYDEAESALQTLTALEREPNIVAANFYLLEGEAGDVNTPFATYVRKGSSVPPAISHTLGTLQEEQNNHLYFFHPVKRDGKWVGFLELRTDLTERSQKIAHYLTTGGGVFLVALVLSMGISMYLGRVISSPISELSRFVQKVAEQKDFTSRIRGKSKDEIGHLAEGLNTMLDRIQEQDVSLRNYSEEMESLVEARTRELKKEIAERKNLETMLLKTRDQLQQNVRERTRELDATKTALDLNSLVVIFDAEEKITYVNDKFCEVSKFSKHELLGQTLRLLNSDYHSEEFFDEIRRTISQGKLWRGEIRNRAKDGAIFWVDSSVVPMLDENGRPYQFVSIRNEITKTKVAEEALRKANVEMEERVAQRTSELEEKSLQQARAEKFLSSIVENLPITVFIKDAKDLRFIMWNKAGEDLTGYTNAEMIGKSDYDFFPKEQAEKYVAADRASLENGRLVIVEEEPVKTKKQGTRFTRTLKVPICDESGKPVYLLGISEDITERKKTETELKKVNQKLIEASRQAGMAEIATGILHNVGNVLNSVNVSVNFLESKVRYSKIESFFKSAGLIEEHKDDLVKFFTVNPKGPELLKFLVNLSEYLQIERATVLDELSNLSRNVDHIKQIVVRQQTYAKFVGMNEDFSVTDVVEDALRLCNERMERLNIKVHKDYSEVPEICSDRHKLLQILVNLVRNAKDAMSKNEAEDRHLKVRVAQERDHRIIIEVSDNGIGLTSHALNRIFQMGFTTKKSGHGFGLHSAALAARELGGKLDVSSDGSNCGATFSLELPCLKQARKSGSKEVEASALASVA